jgi:hypothetical protein
VADLIYLDAAASTPIAPEAFAATVEVLQHTGNPGAAHIAGHGRTNLPLIDVLAEDGGDDACTVCHI